MKKKTLLSWSSGKDSAWALNALRSDPEIDIGGLFTVVNETYGRVSMHSTRLELLQLQAAATGLPLHVISIPYPCSNEQYKASMQAFIQKSRESRVAYMAFGDLFLRDVRKYRETQLHGTGITPIFPLWDIPTRALAKRMLSSGMKAYISCIDPEQLPVTLAGSLWSSKLLDDLPTHVDPCGENGEFHTIVIDGPFFSHPIGVNVGKTAERAGFIFTDIIPVKKKDE